MLKGQPGCFWLDSCPRGGTAGRYSIMGSTPVRKFIAHDDRYRLSDAAGCVMDEGTGDPLARLEHWLEHFSVQVPDSPPVPFHGGAVGFLSYELGAALEPKAGAPDHAEKLCPDIYVAWYDAAFVWDHQTGESWLVGLGAGPGPAAALAGLQDVIAGLPVPSPDATTAPGPRSVTTLPGWSGPETAAGPDIAGFSASATPQGYAESVRQAKELIAAGEIYQVNLAHSFSCKLAEPPAEAYLRLRRLNPAPMACYLAADDLTILSSSPERFIVKDGDRIQTFPIKGTRPRGRDPGEDAALKRELCASEKERAELLMIVDLLRNDLGRLCQFGSIEVRQLHELQTFATVHHLVADITGRLRPGTGVAGILRAMFPGGSITGAPKIRAMRVIRQLEQSSRGIFTGAIGYWSAGGRIDLNLAIRTIVCRAGVASFHVGAGIVADSDPAKEYEETLAKGRALFAALAPAEAPPEFLFRNGDLVARTTAGPEPANPAGVFETIRICRGRPEFLAAHARRFLDGCDYFRLSTAGNAPGLGDLSARLIAANRIEEGFLRWAAWRTDTGSTEWRIETGSVRPHVRKPEWQATICPRRLPRPGPEIRFKRLQRAIWGEALSAARASGFDESFLLDQQGYLVEGAISNVFIVRQGVLSTPPLPAGPLPGVARGEVLRLAGGLGLSLAEQSLTLEDLFGADEVFVTNSLVGLCPIAAVDGHRYLRPRSVTLALQAAWAGRSRTESGS